MSRYVEIEKEIKNEPLKWVVTGAAGFIGSNLVERLLILGQTVLGVDNLSNGFLSNLDGVRKNVGEVNWKNFSFSELDVAASAFAERISGYEVILHQAALGSVPRSIDNPGLSMHSNVEGTANVFKSASVNKIQRVVYASSSSTYGDAPLEGAKKEGMEGAPLSPYAASKAACELLGEACSRVYGITIVGLKYFNVFGPRQRPDGPYAAVMSRWGTKLLAGEEIEIHGDGKQSRDFSFIENVIQANILAAIVPINQKHVVCNIALGGSVSLSEMYTFLVDALEVSAPSPKYVARRAGDIDSSRADITRAREVLGYEPAVSVEEGIRRYGQWLKMAKSLS